MIMDLEHIGNIPVSTATVASLYVLREGYM